MQIRQKAFSGTFRRADNIVLPDMKMFFARRKGGRMGRKKKRKPPKWKKKFQKEMMGIVKEKAKTERTKEKLRRKAVKVRKKNVEKGLERLLAAGCFLVCLAAALMDAKDNRKK